MAKEVLTHTKRRDFKNCHRYFLHRHVQHLSPRKQKRGRRRGTLFGETLLHVRLTFGKDGTISLDKMSKVEQIETIRSFIWQYLEQEYERLTETGLFEATEIEELEVERIKIGVMVYRYVEIYGIDPRRELVFTQPLINPATGHASRTFELGGKIDGLVVTGEKQAAVIEDKLVGQIQRAMIERLELDDQSSEYIDALNSRGWTGQVWYRHTRMPGINPKPAKQFKTKDDYPGETLDEYEDRLLADTYDRQEFYFDQQFLPFPSDHMQDYRQGRWQTAQDIQAKRNPRKPRGKNPPTREDQILGQFYMNPSRCWEYGGCEFIPLCTKVEEAINLYEVVEDNPELGGVTSEYGSQES